MKQKIYHIPIKISKQSVRKGTFTAFLAESEHFINLVGTTSFKIPSPTENSKDGVLTVLIQ